MSASYKNEESETKLDWLHCTDSEFSEYIHLYSEVSSLWEEAVHSMMFRTIANKIRCFNDDFISFFLYLF